MNVYRASIALLVAAAASGCTPRQVLRGADASQDRLDASSNDPAAEVADIKDTGGAEPAPTCTGGLVEGSPCTSPGFFNFDEDVGAEAGLQGFTGTNNVQKLRTWCSHTWCGQGALTFDCHLDMNPLMPNLNQCSIMALGRVPVAGEAGAGALAPDSTIRLAVKVEGLTKADWMRVYVQVADANGWLPAALFAGYASTSGWTNLSVKLPGSGLKPPLRSDIGIYVDINDDQAVWDGTIWIDEIDWN